MFFLITMTDFSIFLFLGFISSFRVSIATKITLRKVPSNEKYFFDLELFQNANRNVNVNTLVSPVAVKLLLTIIMEGAKGETASEIRKALQLPNNEFLAKKKIQKWTDSLTKKSSNTVLKIANRIYVNDKYQLNKTYRKYLKSTFKADVVNISLKSQKEAVKSINTWVRNETSGLIHSVVRPSDIDENFVTAPVNAVYFKAKWLYEFPIKRTRYGCFKQKNREGRLGCAKVKMMEIYARFQYADIPTLKAEVVNLPFQDERFSLLIIKPDKQNGVEDLMKNTKKINLEMIDSILNKEVRMHLLLPKFFIIFKKDLKESLRALNIENIFGPNADLSSMIRGSSFVSRVFHKARIVFDEEGSKAYDGAVGVAISTRYNPFFWSKKFFVDHPFIFFIRDIKTDTILFAGKFSSFRIV